MASTTTRTTLGPWYSWLRAGLHVLVPIESACLVIVTSETPWSVPIDVGRQPRDRRIRSFAARVGQDSGRSAPCVQPNTPDGHHRENVRSARDVLPRSVQFSVATNVRFSVAIDNTDRRENDAHSQLECRRGTVAVFRATEDTDSRRKSSVTRCGCTTVRRSKL